MAKTSRRTLLAATPALVTAGAAAGADPASEVARAHAAYRLINQNTFPLERYFETEAEFRQAENEWWPEHEAAVHRLAAARSSSLADLEIKLRVFCDRLKENGYLNRVYLEKRSFSSSGSS